VKKGDLIFYGVLGVAAYLAYRYAKGALSTLTAPVSQGIADAYLRLTSPGVLQPESQTMGIPGSVTFPNGQSVSFANIQNQGGVWSATDSQGNFYFTYQGGPVYQLQGSSASGWLAVSNPNVSTLSQANLM
jgi:hypothetical protein